MSDTAPLRTNLIIDVMPFARTSDWTIKESLDLVQYGTMRRTINGANQFAVLPGFQKYKLAWSASGVRRPPAFDGMGRGQRATIVPIKEMEAFIPAGATSVTLGRTPHAGSIIVNDDSDFTLLAMTSQWTVGGASGRVVTLGAARATRTTVRYRQETQFDLESLKVDWDAQHCECGWNMDWVEV